MRCSKHEPKSPDDVFRMLRGDVVCARCGRRGIKSRGNRKFGRPPRIIWLRDETPDPSHATPSPEAGE
jgi:hypothetical protein